MTALSPHTHYKHSGVPWFAQIPSNWRPVAVKHLSSRITDGAHVSPDPEGGPYPFISTRDLTPSGIDFEGALTTSERSFEQLERQGCRPKLGEILFSKDGTIGRTTVVTDDREFVVASSLIIITPDLQKVDPMYLDFLFQSTPVQEQVRSFVKGTGLPRISIRNLNRIIGLQPTLSEQHRIAQFLTAEVARIDRLTGDQERLIGLLAEKRQAIITHTVTKGLDPTVPTKPSGIPWLGDIPSHWTVPQLGMHAKVGNGSTPNRDTTEYWSGGNIPWLNSSHVNRDEITDSDQFVSEAATTECHLPLVGAESLLVGLTGQGRTRGMTSILRFPATINQHVAYVTPEPSVWNSEYLLWFLRSSYERLRELSDENGSTKGALTCTAIKKLNIALPPQSEQCAIAANITEQLAELDRIVAASRATIELLRERRAALISAAVTGDMQVK